MMSKMDFENFIETAWNDHADQPEVVAVRLQESLAEITESERIAPYARLVTHVFGEHLARWSDGIALLESIRHCSGWDDAGSDAATLGRNIAVLDYCAGNLTALSGLSGEDRVAVLATASSALAGQGDYTRAINAFQQAEQAFDAGWLATSPAIRALAVNGNNLAVALEEKSVRDAFESQGMVAAAVAGLKYWTLAGTWLQQERAEYRLAKSLLKADRRAEAVDHAQRCVAICVAHEATPFEHFFAYAVLAIAQRAARDIDAYQLSREQALRFYQRIPVDEQVWCAVDLTELNG